MATIDLNWDNTAVNASGNVTGQRASKRIKAVGGAWSTSGFMPANDMAKAVNYTSANITSNRIYEFKIETLCSVGGPIINDNGIKEGIVFECAGGFSSEPGTSGQLKAKITGFNVSVPDFNKVKFALYDASNTTLLATSPELNNSSVIQYIFTGLTPLTEYFVRVI